MWISSEGASAGACSCSILPPWSLPPSTSHCTATWMRSPRTTGVAELGWRSSDCPVSPVAQKLLLHQVGPHDVLVVPGLICNLFSITKALSGGAKLSNEDSSIIVGKGSFQIKFNVAVKTHEGHIMGARIQTGATSSTNNKEPSRMYKAKRSSMNMMYKALEHVSEGKTVATTKKLGIKLNGHLDKCVSCALGKMRQANVSKSAERASKPGSRLFFGLSSVRKSSQSGSKHWILVVDNYILGLSGVYL